MIMSWTSFSMWIQWRCPFCDRTNHIGNFFVLYACICFIHHFSVWIQLWQWLCHPRLYFENIWHGHHQALFFSVNSVVTVIMSSGDYILKIYNMVITRHCFQCEFSWDSDYVISRLHFENIWYGHHQTLFFSVNSVVTVIVSSGGYILKIYDMSSPGTVFQCEFSCNMIMSFEDYILKRYHMVITRHNFSVWIQP